MEVLSALFVASMLGLSATGGAEPACKADKYEAPIMVLNSDGVYTPLRPNTSSGWCSYQSAGIDSPIWEPTGPEGRTGDKGRDDSEGGESEQ